MSTLYPRVVRMVREQPWAIEPEMLTLIADLVAFRAGGGRLTDEEIRARLGGEPPEKRQPMAFDPRAGTLEPMALGGRPQRPGVVAVLPVFGLISHRAGMMSEMSGGTSTETLAKNLRLALAEPSVSAVVLDVNSPGGLVQGVPEIGKEIRASRGRKPIVAVANANAGSAAYWIASQANEVVATPSAMVGSVGVLVVHEERSKLLEKVGVTVTQITYGEHKGEVNAFEPLSEEAREYLQSQVNMTGAMFVSEVAKGRGVSAETVKSDFGKGRSLDAKSALAVGMVDRVATMDETLRRVARPQAPEGVERRRAEAAEALRFL